MALQEAIDNFKTLSSQNGELLGQNNILIRKVNKLSELAKGKQEIVDAINMMGGNASIEDSLYTLGEKIEQLVVVSPDTTFTDDVPTPINLSTIAVQPAIYAPCVKHLYSEDVTNIGKSYFYQNNSLETVNLPNLTTISTAECFYYCSALREVYLPKLTKLNSNNFTACTNLYILEIPSVEAFNTKTNTFMNCTSLIDMVIGKNLISNADFTSIKYAPTTAYSKATNSLCHDTDLERYGQTFASNWDKWKWCIINHFAANLLDRTGMEEAFTITFGSTVLAQFDEEMIAAFTDKNWTLA
jgi:hypothetical protein